MNEVSQLRESICALARSLFERGLTHGGTGNISARLADGGLLVTPSGSSLGRLDPARLSHISADGVLVAGDKPTKEMPMHQAFYDTRPQTNAVVHLHSCYSVALSTLPVADPDNMLVPLTPYCIMQLGKVKLLPYFLPGAPEIGEAIRALEGKYAAVMLANHGPVVTGKSLDAAVNAAEELEASAKLAVLTRGLNPTQLTSSQIKTIVNSFEVDW
nr:aldolase [uncultured Cohaesibacter sp.]